MIRWLVVGLSVPLIAAGTAQAQQIPTCRVRLVKSAATESVSKSVFRQVEVWVNAPERGTRLAPTIDEADVLLEFSDYRPMSSADGGLLDEWRFVARGLSEPSRERGSFRFSYFAALDRNSHARVANRLPVVLTDVCFGYLPKVASDR
jgi:hypothetical protein